MKKLKLSEKKLLLLINLTERRYLGTAAAASTGSAATGQPQKPNFSKVSSLKLCLFYFKICFFFYYNRWVFLGQQRISNDVVVFIIIGASIGLIGLVRDPQHGQLDHKFDLPRIHQVLFVLIGDFISPHRVSSIVFIYESIITIVVVFNKFADA